MPARSTRADTRPAGGERDLARPRQSSLRLDYCPQQVHICASIIGQTTGPLRLLGQVRTFQTFSKIDKFWGNCTRPFHVPRAHR